MSLTPDIERVLSEHRPIMVRKVGGTADCSCGATLTTEDATILDFLAEHDRHLAQQIAALVEQREETAKREALLGAADHIAKKGDHHAANSNKATNTLGEMHRQATLAGLCAEIETLAARPSWRCRMTYAKPGRASVKVRVAHVEDTACPDSDGNHELTNAWAVTRCRFCLRDWPTLDAEIRRGAA